MPRFRPSPLVVHSGSSATPLERLPRAHAEFDEEFLQELLVEHPDLLPIRSLREDAGELVCIGREVGAGESGSIDNLYLSTGGYPVVVETKLWRNPQARREVLSQVLDYVKEIVARDFEWLEEQWREFNKQRQGIEPDLMRVLNNRSSDEIDPDVYVDRVNRALTRGDVLALIVGDGIETRLQELVDHLCRDSAHLRYSLALVELECYRMPGEGEQDLIVVPRIVGDVEPVERAYVRIEPSEGLEDLLRIESVAEVAPKAGSGKRRVNLTQDDFIAALDEAVGHDLRQTIEEFYTGLVMDLRLETDFKAAAVMLKIPDPAGEKPGASVLGIEREVRVYNSDHLPGQLMGWGIPESKVSDLTGIYWERLHTIDSRFDRKGISHVASNRFLPIKDLVDRLGDIGEAVTELVARVREAAESST